MFAVPFKLHVFNPVAEAGFARDFVARADIVPEPKADDGRGVDFFEIDLQAVFQR